MPALPAECPYATPGDDDLSGVVTRLTTLTTRRGPVDRDPNEPEVRWLLEAGIRALGEAVLDRSSERTGPVAYSHANGLFDTLPIERVMRCFRDMCHEQGIDPGSANKARLIRRWSFAANYQLDLIAYIFRPAVLDHSIGQAERRAHDALPNLTIGEFVDGFTTPESSFSPIDTLFRVQHVLRLMFPRDEAICAYASRLYDMRNQRWGAFFAAFAEAYGLTYVKHTPTDVAMMLSLIAEGGLFRVSSLPRSCVTSDDTPLVVAAARTVFVDSFGMPWKDLADRRAVTSTLPHPQLIDATTAPAAVLAADPLATA